jgi:hypothetical protein
MFTYWSLYLVPFLAEFFPWKFNRKDSFFLFILFGITATLVIGLRHEIGNDWFHYLGYYNEKLNTNLQDLLYSNFEPGYAFINWVCIQLNLGLYGVNLICSTIFIFGLIFFSKTLPYRWISIGIAMPVIGIVFAMGATRQVAALGFLYIAIKYLMQGSRAKYLIFICLAITFHKSAVLMIPFGMIGGVKTKLIYQFFFVLLFLFAIWLFWEIFANYYEYYVNRSSMVKEGGSMYASGARPRVWLNAIPVLLYLLLSKNKTLFKEAAGSFWKYLFIATIISIPLVEFYSAATDRVNFYFSVVQIMVWPRIICMQHSKFNKALVAVVIFVLYFLVLFTWLNFAKHRDVYIPYRNIMFLEMYEKHIRPNDPIRRKN